MIAYGYCMGSASVYIHTPYTHAPAHIYIYIERYRETLDMRLFMQTFVVYYIYIYSI